MHRVAAAGVDDGDTRVAARTQVIVVVAVAAAQQIDTRAAGIQRVVAVAAVDGIVAAVANQLVVQRIADGGEVCRSQRRDAFYPGIVRQRAADRGGDGIDAARVLHDIDAAAEHIHVHSPSPPRSVSVPSPPSITLLPVVPVMMLTRELPVALPMGRPDRRQIFNRRKTRQAAGDGRGHMIDAARVDDADPRGPRTEQIGIVARTSLEHVNSRRAGVECVVARKAV